MSQFNVLKKIAYSDNEFIAFDIECHGLEFHLPSWEIWGVSFSDGENHCYLDVLDIDKCSKQTGYDAIKNTLSLLMIKSKTLVGHNIKFDLRGLHAAKILDNYQLVYDKVVDTQIAMNMVDPSLMENQLGLKPLSKQKFKADLPTYKETIDAGRFSKTFRTYATNDARYTYRLWEEEAEPELVKQKLMRLLRKITMRSLIYLCEMEDSGIKWSLDRGKELLALYYELRKVSEEKLREILGHDINLASGDQLAERLFVDMKDRFDPEALKIKKTASGKRYSVDTATVERLTMKDPVFKMLTQYRNAEKMINTYIEPLCRRSMRDAFERIHASFHQTSKTGRKRSSNPNLQNIPVIYDKTLNIRSGFVARKGFKLVVADLAQIELRMGAHVTQDPLMIDTYRSWTCNDCKSTGKESRYLSSCPKCGAEENEDVMKGKEGAKGFFHGLDIHQMTADALGIPRNPSAGVEAAAKNVNFACLYMATAWKLEQQFGVYTEDEWKEILRKFFRKWRGVKRWHNQMIELMEETGVVTNVFGRHMKVTRKEIKKSWKHTLNRFINFPIQSAAGNYLELCAIKMRDACIEKGTWLVDVFPVMEVHDEIVFEVREDIAQETLDLLIYCMRYAADLAVPINAEGGIYNSFGEAK
jgi:DNA polymerase-1